MKQILKLFIFFIFTISCYAQHFVTTVNDAKKIKENEQLFINKPLKDLLKEIKPQIKMVTANPTAYAHHRGIGYFQFRFLNTKEYDSVISKNKTPVAITVYVKGVFEWDIQKRPKGKEFIWIKEDEEKYGNLTIVGFRIYGEE